MNLSRISKRKVCFIHILFSMKENHLSSQYCSSYRQKSEDVQIVHIYIRYKNPHYRSLLHHYRSLLHHYRSCCSPVDRSHRLWSRWILVLVPVQEASEGKENDCVFCWLWKLHFFFSQIIVINSNFAVPCCDNCRLQFQLVPTLKLNCINSSPKSSVLVKSNQ